MNKIIALLAAVFMLISSGCVSTGNASKIAVSRVWIDVAPALSPVTAEIFYGHAASCLAKKGFTLTQDKPEVVVKYEQIRESTVGDVSRSNVIVGGLGGPLMALPMRGSAQSYVGEEGVVNFFCNGTRLGGKYANWPIDIKGYASKQKLLKGLAWHLCVPIGKAFSPRVDSLSAN